MATAKDQVRRLIDALPDDATLENIQHSIYVREHVERARSEAAEGKVLEEDESETRHVRARALLWENERD